MYLLIILFLNLFKIKIGIEILPLISAALYLAQVWYAFSAKKFYFEQFMSNFIVWFFAYSIDLLFLYILATDINLRKSLLHTIILEEELIIEKDSIEKEKTADIINNKAEIEKKIQDVKAESNFFAISFGILVIIMYILHVNGK